MNQRATEYDLNDVQFEQLMDKYVMTIVNSSKAGCSFFIIVVN